MHSTRCVYLFYLPIPFVQSVDTHTHSHTLVELSFILKTLHPIHSIPIPFQHPNSNVVSTALQFILYQQFEILRDKILVCVCVCALCCLVSLLMLAAAAASFHRCCLCVVLPLLLFLSFLFTIYYLFLFSFLFMIILCTCVSVRLCMRVVV